MTAPLNLHPTKEEALQLALMLKSGMPAINCIPYFFPDDESVERLRFELERWLRSSTLKRAIEQVQGKPWQDMTLSEQINFAIDKHYAELAYFLYSHNYSDMNGADKQKADTARQVLEAKLAGMSGKLNPLDSWFADVRSGKIKLGMPV